MNPSRARQIAYYGLPMLFCLAVHWLGLKTWFYKDDFAWLGLPLSVHSPTELMQALFSPQAQGTVRTLSERAFFLVFTSIFGIESPPFRIWAFLTQFANIALLIQIARRLTGSDLAGFIAPFLWSANAALALAISWSAAYNEIAFAFFILLAFRLWLAYIDTGQRKYWIWQWVVFLLGFGALELNVVYPALASGYALCRAPKYFRKSLLLFVPSILYTVVHFAFIPMPTDDYYKMHFDSGVFSTAWHYWIYAVGAARQDVSDWRPVWLGVAIAVLLTAALGVFLYGKLRDRDWLPVFLVGWFFAVLAPLIPLKNHFTEYYLTVPVLGLAILGAWAIASSTRPVTLAIAATLTCLYLVVSISDNRVSEKYYYDRARRMKYLFKGLEAQQKIHATDMAIMSGIDSDLFWTGFCDDAFRLIGIWHVYLAPGSAKAIEPHPEWGCDTSKFFVDLNEAVPLLRTGRGAVYALEGRRVHNVTQSFLSTPLAQDAERHSDFVDVGDPMFQNRLGPSWYPAESGYRWMPKTATVKMHGPATTAAKLEADGYCPAAVLAQGPQNVTIRADGVLLGTAAVTKPDQLFKLQFALPAELVGRPMIEIQVEVSHTIQPGGETRPLGLVFTTFRIK